MQTLFYDTPAAARTAYEAQALPVLHKIVSAKSTSPGVSCQRCKIAGCCSALERIDGFLGQAHRGHATRSVSARDLEIYEKCPAQWHLTSANLPTESESSSASERGRKIHTWLAMTHMSNRGCSPGGIDSSDGSSAPSIDEEEYSEVRDYIFQHVNSCALGQGARVIASEAPIYGYDAKADVIIASKPDLLYIDSDETFVIRETKTTTLDIPQNANEAFDKFFSIPWLLNLFASGYRGPYQSENARLELEVLTPEEGRVFTWDLSDSGLLRMAKAEVRLRARAWHRDTTWSSTPGAHCKWCPVRQWCPDASTAGEADEYDAERAPGR
ncbi:PD-(D/E)XK nuclease family protein [Streptomyces atacamensis]|uniref:PD-(D/E)XK nuclease family protein n=1 Tax=Streptomyces atacamensis TaxID=531966 RepID=UPI00399C7A87